MKGIFFALVMTIAVLGQTPDAQCAERFSIATGGTSGIYFPIGGAIAKAASKTGELQATAESSNASIANINNVAQKEIEMAFAQQDVTYWAYNGQNMFEKPLSNVRTIMALYPEHVHLVVTVDSGIKTFADLKGKRVNVGSPGSGYEADSKAVLDVAGMTFSDVSLNRMDIASAVSRFKDGQLDAAFFVTGYPAPGPMDIATSRAIKLLDYDKAFMDKLIAKYPFFVASTIPGGTYDGTPETVNTPAVMALIVTHDGVSEDTVYKFLTNVFNNLPEIHASHAKAKDITLENAMDGVVAAPLHPGAAKFFKEKGLTFPAGVVVGK